MTRTRVDIICCSLLRSRRCITTHSCSTISFNDVVNSGDIWSKVYADQNPVLIKNIARDWPAIIDPSRQWSSMDYLKERYGEHFVQIESGGDYMNRSTTLQTVTFQDALQKISESDSSSYHCYLAQNHLNNIPSLENDIILPDICKTGRGLKQYHNIWIGNKNTSSPCHYDPYQNILVQVYGKKRVLLISKSLSSYMYPHVFPQHNTSQINFNSAETIDTVKYPMVAHLVAYEAILEPGDGLFIPLKWWHYCQGLSFNCSVNCWWL
jgi:lysine-specific demethylase 8